MVFNYEIDLDTMKEKCDNFNKSEIDPEVRTRSEELGFAFSLGLTTITIIPLTISYFIPVISTAIMLGLLAAILLVMSLTIVLEVYKDVRRGILSYGYLSRFLTGQTMMILSPVIQVLFVYDIVPVGYICWILLTGGLALSWMGKMKIEARELEAKKAVEDINEVIPLPRGLISSLEQEQLGIRIQLPYKIRVGENIVMTLHVVNNTNADRDIELKYMASCFEPASDSIPIRLVANSAKQVKYVAHIRSKGDYVVKAQIIESQKIVTGKFKKISIRNPLTSLLKPVNIFRGLLGLASVSMTIILLIPDVIQIFSK